jgi:hypothetical protein
MRRGSGGAPRIVSGLQSGVSKNLGNMLIATGDERSESGTSFGFSASKQEFDSIRGDTLIFLVTTRDLDWRWIEKSWQILLRTSHLHFGLWFK